MVSTIHGKPPERFRKDQRGSVLIELVVAAMIFAVVVAAIAYYFIYHVGTMNNGRAQLKLQRVGSLLMDEMTRALREGKTVRQAEGPMEIGVSYANIMVIYPDTGTRCFSFDGANQDIIEGPDYDTLSPMEVLDDSQTVGSDTRDHRIYCDELWFRRGGDRVVIQFNLRHDMDNSDGHDDLTIDFGSTVKLRG